LPWHYSPNDTPSDSDLNDFYEEGSGSDSGFSTASSSHYLRIQTPPHVNHLKDLGTAEGAELEEENDFFDPDAIDFPEWEDNLSRVRLPHVPLRPFRNQVGGHSAIYKFTRRAVCKVCLGNPTLRLSNLTTPCASATCLT
jgi:inositol-hexakisphosphate kinase